MKKRMISALLAGLLMLSVSACKNSEPAEDQSPQADMVTKYYYMAGDCSWSEAAEKAREMGGHLATFETESEYAAMVADLNSQNMSNMQFRIGARRDLEGDGYYWVDETNTAYGEPLNDPDAWCASRWLEGEPSYGWDDLPEAYVSIYFDQGRNDWVWNDVADEVYSSESGKFGFIVEAQVPADGSGAPSLADYGASGEDQPALDVMFVIDGSGSMCRSDPNGIAKEACRLFSDMCDYENTRAGYVFFSGAIRDSMPLTSLADPYERENVRARLDSIRYPQSASTDISLGLTTAMNMLVESGSLDGTHSPMVILLSDGRTEDLTAERAAVYDEEFNNTVNYLSANGVSVYTIALTASGDVDEQTLQDIAGRTNALYFATDTADDLPSILSEILAHQLRVSIHKISEFVSDGQATTVAVNIPNDSIYQANIIILSGKGVHDLHLREPGGNEVLIPSEKILTAHSSTYDLIKLLRPAKGEWQLTLTGVSQDNVTINLINNYDMELSLTADKTTVSSGGTLQLEAFFSDAAGAIDDDAVFNGAEGVVNIVNLSNGQTQTEPMRQSGGKMVAPVVLTDIGHYQMQAHIRGSEGSFEKDSVILDITCVPQSIAVKGGSNSKDLLMFSPFLGIKALAKKSVPISSLATWDHQATLSVNALSGQWQEYFEADYDAEAQAVKLVGIKPGSETIALKIGDNYGQAIDFDLHVTLIPGWIPVVAVLAIAALAALVLWRWKKAREPYLNGKLSIATLLPGTLQEDTPPQYEIDLRDLGVKGKCSFETVLNANMTVGGQYSRALSAISDFIKKIFLESKDESGSCLYIHIPAPAKGHVAYFNNFAVEKPTKQIIPVGEHSRLNYETESGVYQLFFTYGSDQNGFTGEEGFGGDEGFGDEGFGGGFGGGFDSGFGGGFDAPPSDGGFGAGFDDASGDDADGGFGSGF